MRNDLHTHTRAHTLECLTTDRGALLLVRFDCTEQKQDKEFTLVDIKSHHSSLQIRFCLSYHIS